ncbi:MAG: hypothetical protein EP346_13770 [Bacteroidetes bacterium]|uniref:ATP-binding protein n=1 Tax=Phaeocystidibacter marisrubri TaxID=1577780 RepID=A0A6L3ZF96_9FLAO|nr:ATP-binding protein [Phaeocystidibacter marisrubri]KAB2816082.1 ATP-binding protein [Phaeocystidibacter marisrubri]TNE26236.1 MAG: hypothetical protein EP346_13770 [Bacteroidota bacterium]GGH67238.1 hypothetical protein GCM10011318_06010 [Phaeocystidibacter marisrubri]
MPNKIVVTGPESTGKSSISSLLAEELNAVHVPEMARGYLEQLDSPYSEEDMHAMANLQFEKELDAANSDVNTVVCDTDLLTFIIWWEVKFGRCPDTWKNLWMNNLPDFYLIMDIDLPWEDDPLREHPHRRAELMERYTLKIEECKIPYSIISGSGEERFHQALAAIHTIY